MMGGHNPQQQRLTEQCPPGQEDFRVPFRLTGLPVTGNFVDRDTEMGQIERSLIPPNAQDRRRIHVLYGLGGIGKTQLAIAYARKHHQRYSAMLWLNGNSRDRLVQSLAVLAEYAGIGRTQESTIDVVGHGHELESECRSQMACP